MRWCAEHKSQRVVGHACKSSSKSWVSPFNTIDHAHSVTHDRDNVAQRVRTSIHREKTRQEEARRNGRLDALTVDPHMCTRRPFSTFGPTSFKLRLSYNSCTYERLEWKVGGWNGDRERERERERRRERERF
jgi:hypothetical protein